MVFGWMSIQPLGFLRELGVFIWSGVRTAQVTPTVTHGLLIFPHTKGVPLGLLFSEFLTLCLVNSKNTYTCSQINPIWGKSQLRSCPVPDCPWSACVGRRRFALHDPWACRARLTLYRVTPGGERAFP